MAVPLALPLAPVVAPGATAAAATFVIGSSAALAKTVYGFRRDRPVLPPLTGREGEATLREKLADFWAGAQVPVGNPVPPPFNPGGLGVMAAAAAGLWQLGKGLLDQLWGLVNGPARNTTAPEVESQYPYGLNPDDPYQGTTGWRVPKPGQHLIIKQVSNSGSLNSWYAAASINALAIGGEIPSNPLRRYNNYDLVTTGGANVRCVSPPCAATQNVIGYRVETSDGLPGLEAMPLGSEPLPDLIPEAWTSPFQWPESIKSAGAISSVATAPVAPNLLPAPVPNASTVTQGGTTSSSAGSAATAPLSPWPLQSTGSSGTSTSTSSGSGSLPALPAYLPPLVQPAPAEPITQTQTDGALVPVAPAPVVATSPDAITPYPGAAPLTGNGPAPNLEEMAKELGRIESKLELLLQAPTAPGGDLGDLLGPLLNGLFQLLQSFFDGAPAGEYELSSPCQLDAEGERIVFTAPYDETSSDKDAILARLDALADLLQVHKDLKQPNCTGSPIPIGGEFVTVNFEEID